MDPSRWRCSSALGREAILAGRMSDDVMRESSVWQLRAAGVFPRGVPERAHIGCRVRELANQNGRGLVVEAVVILICERVLAAARVAIGEKDGLQPAV